MIEFEIGKTYSFEQKKGYLIFATTFVSKLIGINHGDIPYLIFEDDHCIDCEAIERRYWKFEEIKEPNKIILFHKTKQESKNG